ncbi:hypothetical protein B7494_g5802 [Chlorociboria aeruginascens]|nr:hypothetical protein B7494_g5802 [Chlorociboria aeruginascens]
MAEAAIFLVTVKAPESPIRSLDAALENTLRLSLLLASLACILRPTNLLIWTNVIMPTITRLIEPRFVNLKDYLILARECVICGLAVILVSGLSDRLYFGEWTFPPYQWYHFNVSQGLAVFYGRNVWHYYFSQGLPLLLTTYLPFALYALYILVINIRSPSKSIYVAPDISFILTNTLYSTLITFSLISHKEVRFIYPLLPILHILIAPTVTNYFYTKSTRKIHPPPFPSAPQTERITVTRHKKSLYLLLILNIAISYYTTQIHQSGVLSVQTFLRQEYERLVFNGSAYPIPSSLSNGEETFVAYLMPCHSVPWRSSLAHSNLTAWALTCEPPLSIPLNTPEREAYRDEADRFYDDPEKFLREEVGGRERPWPRFVVGFQGIEEGLRKWYEANNKGWEMREKWRGKNSDWHDDWRRQGDVVVWEFGIAN